MINYEYTNLPIGGGGYVTGLTFAETKSNVLYARTDIGGVYRFDFENECWNSLADPVGIDEIELTHPLAIALDEQASTEGELPLYIACGNWRDEQGLLAITEDGGAQFYGYAIPAPIHGNRPGRGTGTRMVVRDGIIYLATMSRGLLMSRDGGASFEALDASDYQKFVKGETNLTFVWCGEGDNARTIVIGTAGKENTKHYQLANEVSYQERGNSLYVSFDGGINFAPLPTPTYPLLTDCERMLTKQLEDKKDATLLQRLLEQERREVRGYVAQRYSYDGEWLYVTMNGAGEETWCGLDGYSSEAGRPCKGRIVKYRFEKNKLVEWVDITPTEKTFKKTIPKQKGLFGKALYKLDRMAYPFGFGGISCVRSEKGFVVATTFGGHTGSTILRSLDGGKNWEIVLHNLEIGDVWFSTNYMKPKYNGNRLLTHWMVDLKINPHNTDEAWFVTGTGVFRTQNLKSEDVLFTDVNVGLEETVHLNVYGLPIRHKADQPVTRDTVAVVDCVGDLGGFVFRDAKKQCDNTIEDEKHNRYITAMNADYARENPDYIVMTPRGNWTGETKGGVIVSKDGGQTWKQATNPRGLSDVVDALLTEIEQPNRNSGFVAVSADAGTIVWSIAEGRELPSDAVVYSTDDGMTWQLSKVRQLPPTKNPRLHLEQGDSSRTYLKVMADPGNPERFFGFGNHFRVYISPDAGKHFYEYPVPKELPDVNLSLIERSVEIRAEDGKCGVFYFACGRDGLWRMEHDPTTDHLKFEPLHQEGEEFYCIGLGIGFGVTERNYASSQKTLYTVAKLQTVNGLQYGFYRSIDGGVNWEPISNERQRYGQIRSIDGDKRIFGRFYIGSGSRGLLMGEERQ